MGKKGKTISRTLIGLLIGVIVFVVLVIVFISPITKYLIENYSEKYTGRKIKLSWCYVNPFTGYVHFSDLKVYEEKSDSIFFATKSISVNFEVLKAIGKTYEIGSLTIEEPYAKIIQDHDYFNFNDLVKKFASKEPKDTTKPPVHFNLLNVKISGGEFHYIERSIPVNYFVKEVNVSMDGMRWNVDTMMGTYALQNGPGSGSIRGTYMFNKGNMDFRATSVIKRFDLFLIEQYLKDIANYGTFTALLDANIKGSGNVKDSLMGLQAQGFLAVSDFHFGKTRKEDYASFKQFAINMIDVSPRNFKYIIDTVMLDEPYFKYEKYDYLDNVQRMFGKGGANYKEVKGDATKFNLIVVAARFVNELAKNFLQSYYKIKRVGLYDGNIVFNDFSPREKFSIAANPLNIRIDSMDKNYRWMNIRMNTGLKPYGSIAVGVKINPNDYGDFLIDYDVNKIPLSIANPYLLSFTSFPIDRGTISLNGKWVVKDSAINSDNRLLVLDPDHGKRVKKKDTKWIPIPLLLSIVRAPSNAIDFDIPIRGNLKNPKFVVKDAIMDVLTNLFVKPPLTPYLVRTRQVETEVEKYLTLKWETNQTELRPNQEKFLKRIAKFLKKNPEAALTVEPFVYKDKEKEYLLFFAAKKHYYTKGKEVSLSEKDSLFVDKMSIKDSCFLAYLHFAIKDTLLFTVQEKCRALVGDVVVNKAFKKLEDTRERVFYSYFDSTNIAGRLTLKPDEYGVPFNGYSYYRIRYKGEIPEDLREAFEDMMEINRNAPRGKYKEERKRNRDVLTKTI